MHPDKATTRLNPLLALGEQWLAAWRLGAALSWAGMASLAQLTDARSARTAWSRQLSGIVDRTLRSPEFLRLMACQMRAMANVAQLTSASRPR